MQAGQFNGHFLIDTCPDAYCPLHVRLLCPYISCSHPSCHLIVLLEFGVVVYIWQSSDRWCSEHRDLCSNLLCHRKIYMNKNSKTGKTKEEKRISFLDAFLFYFQLLRYSGLFLGSSTMLRLCVALDSALKLEYCVSWMLYKVYHADFATVLLTLVWVWVTRCQWIFLTYHLKCIILWW